MVSATPGLSLLHWNQGVLLTSPARPLLQSSKLQALLGETDYYLWQLDLVATRLIAMCHLSAQ